MQMTVSVATQLVLVGTDEVEPASFHLAIAVDGELLEKLSAVKNWVEAGANAQKMTIVVLLRDSRSVIDLLDILVPSHLSSWKEERIRQRIGLCKKNKCIHKSANPYPCR